MKIVQNQKICSLIDDINCMLISMMHFTSCKWKLPSKIIVFHNYALKKMLSYDLLNVDLTQLFG